MPIPKDITKEITPSKNKNKYINNVIEGNNSLPSSAVKLNKGNKETTGLKETYSSIKNKNSVVGGLFKKIHLLEFNQKSSINSVDYYLNNYLKIKNVINGTVADISNDSLSPINKKMSSHEIEYPYNLSEHFMPLLDEENIIKILKNNDYFQDQNNDIFNLVLSEIIYITAFQGMKIYDMNDLSNYFFIINKGSVSVNKRDTNKNKYDKINPENSENNNNNNKKIFHSWESFGEISFYNGKKRNEEIIANENVELYAIDSESFRELIKRNNEIILKEKYNFLNNISIFESLDKISKYNVAQKMKKKEFPPNHKIIKKGEVGDTLYILKEGIVSCRIGVKEIRKLSNNECFGLNAILVEVKRGADIIALQKCICYELSKNDLKEALSEDYIDVILFCFFTYCINNNTYMKQIIIDSLIHSIFRCFSIKQYSKKEHICNSKSSDESKKNKKINNCNFWLNL